MQSTNINLAKNFKVKDTLLRFVVHYVDSNLTTEIEVVLDGEVHGTKEVAAKVDATMVDVSKSILHRVGHVAANKKNVISSFSFLMCIHDRTTLEDGSDKSLAFLQECEEKLLKESEGKYDGDIFNHLVDGVDSNFAALNDSTLVIIDSSEYLTKVIHASMSRLYDNQWTPVEGL